jgi:hypothetical protein
VLVLAEDLDGGVDAGAGGELADFFLDGRAVFVAEGLYDGAEGFGVEGFEEARDGEGFAG